jgi:hypothetical protein
LCNKVLGIGGRFDGLVEFLESVELIKVTSGNIEIIRSLSRDGITEEVISRMLCSRRYALQFAKNCQIIEQLGGAPKPRICISAASTSYKFLWFLQTLEQFEVLFRNHETILTLNPRYTSMFEGFLLSAIDEISTYKNITPKQLRKIQEHRELVGLEAERFVMDFERRRLSNHPYKHKISHTALFDVSSGFDILSFNREKDLIPTRRIEVKSWTKDKNFYLSQNELCKAREYGDNYYIYLVDRGEMSLDNYHPEVIRNPSITLFGDSPLADYRVSPHNWFISKAIHP